MVNKEKQQTDTKLSFLEKLRKKEPLKEDTQIRKLPLPEIFYNSAELQIDSNSEVDVEEEILHNCER